MIKEEISKELDSDETLQEQDRGESYGGYYQDDMTDEEFDKFKRALSRAYRAGKRGNELKKVGDFIKARHAEMQTPEYKEKQKPMKFAKSSSGDFNRYGTRIKKNPYDHS